MAADAGILGPAPSPPSLPASTHKHGGFPPFTTGIRIRPVGAIVCKAMTRALHSFVRKFPQYALMGGNGRKTLTCMSAPIRRAWLGPPLISTVGASLRSAKLRRPLEIAPALSPALSTRGELAGDLERAGAQGDPELEAGLKGEAGGAELVDRLICTMDRDLTFSVLTPERATLGRGRAAPRTPLRHTVVAIV